MKNSRFNSVPFQKVESRIHVFPFKKRKKNHVLLINSLTPLTISQPQTFHCGNQYRKQFPEYEPK